MALFPLDKNSLAGSGQGVKRFPQKKFSIEGRASGMRSNQLSYEPINGEPGQD